MSSPAAIDVIQEGSSFQLKPEPFDGDKTKFKSFMRQVMLAFRAAPTKFASDEAKIIFTLHYMTGGFAAEFANAFMDKWDDTTPNATTWSDFKKSLEACFGDSTSQRQAMVDIAKLVQGRLSAVEYLTRFEHLAIAAGYDKKTHFQYLSTLLTNNMNEKLINSFYNTEKLPSTFEGWKTWLLRLEQVWQLRRATEKPPPLPKPLVRPPQVLPRPPQTIPFVKGAGDPMHVDAQKGRPSTQCFNCRGYGHFARDCRNPSATPPDRAQVHAANADKDYMPAVEEDPRDAELASLRDQLENALKLLKEKGFQDA